MKAHLSFVVATAVALAFIATDLDATDCRTAFREFKAKERRKRAVACAKELYKKESKKAQHKYEEALGRVNAINLADRAATSQVNPGGDDQPPPDDAAALHRVIVEEAQRSREQALEAARTKRDQTIRQFTKQGVFTYGGGVAALFPSGERRIIDARLHAEQGKRPQVLPLAYAEEKLSAVAVVTYFPRDLTWGTGNRRWGFGPMVVIGEKGPWETLGLGAMIGVSRSGETEGRLSFGLGVAYYLDNKARTLRSDFPAHDEAPPDRNGGYLAPVFVETTGHAVAAVVTVSVWDRPGKQ